jgi:hypothetical protein
MICINKNLCEIAFVVLYMWYHTCDMVHVIFLCDIVHMILYLWYITWHRICNIIYVILYMWYCICDTLQSHVWYHMYNTTNAISHKFLFMQIIYWWNSFFLIIRLFSPLLNVNFFFLLWSDFIEANEFMFCFIICLFHLIRIRKILIDTLHDIVYVISYM